LTSEQLQNARAERWRQVSNPVLTTEDARAWLEGVGFCLFFPRRAFFSPPAPSFVEAVAGAPTDAPSREAVENATALLHRLTGADGGSAVVPLNLFHAGAFGAAGAGSSDQPDFVVTREALPYVFSLIGGRNWKSGPGGKASPLMVDIWTLLNGSDALTAQEIQTALGRELTETAVLRALVELWSGLRAIPVYDGSASDTKWELTQARFAAEMTASQKVAQTTALSALVSLYLESVVAASSEEIETFLSPLAARSRVREVVNGLSATRQLELVSVGAQPLFHVAGAPEFAAEPMKPVEPAAAVEERRGVEPRAGFEKREAAAPKRFEKRKPFEKRGTGFERRPDGGFKRRQRDERKPFERDERYGERGARSEDRGGFERRRGERPYRKPFDRERRAEGGERGKDRGGFERGHGERKPFDRERRAEGGERRFGDRERRPFEKKPFERTGKAFGARRFDGPKRFVEERSGASGEQRSSGADGRFAAKRFGKSVERGQGKPGGERFGKSGWKPKGARGGFPKQGTPEFRRPGEREEADLRREGRPQFKSGGKQGFGKKKFGERGAGFKKSGFGKSGKPFGKSGKPFKKSGKPFGKPGRPGFGKPGQGGFKPPFRKRRNQERKDGSENAE
jgi:23S rRNA pseudouridine2605 synthase